MGETHHQGEQILELTMSDSSKQHMMFFSNNVRLHAQGAARRRTAGSSNDPAARDIVVDLDCRSIDRGCGAVTEMFWNCDDTYAH